MHAVVVRDTLSTHRTVARFTGYVAGREPLMRIFPPRPAEQWARFAIVLYEAYSKPGQYGDAKVDEFQCVPEEQPAWVGAAIAALAGSSVEVTLAWRHDYVKTLTTAADGRVFTSSSPERIVTQLTVRGADGAAAPPIAGVVFDMDGTLLDSEVIVNEAWFALLRSALGVEMSPDEAKRFVDEICGVVDTAVGALVVERYADAVAAAGLDAPTLVARKRAAYFDLLAQTPLELYPGAFAMVESMAARAKVALCTSSFRRKAETLLRATGLDALLAARIVQEDAMGCTKPDAAPYLRAAALLGLAPAQCVAVEDSPSGVRSAAAAGFARVVAVCTSHDERALRDAGATDVVRDTAAAATLLLKLVPVVRAI